MARHLESCPYYQQACPPTTAPPVATCRLLQRISKVEDDHLCRVPREACVACSEESAPSETHLNPTLASLLFDLTTRLLNGETCVAGDETRRGQTTRLRAWAEDNLFWGAEPAPPISCAPSIQHRIDVERQPDRPLRLGLIGGNAPTGLGALNRAIAQHLPIDRWLIVAHPLLEEQAAIPECRVSRATDPASVRDFLEGLDWLLFGERPHLDFLVPMARELGVRIACVPMWEHLDKFSPWLRWVDLMICPTRYCHALLSDWREQLGLDYDLALVSWPIELDRFPFRLRTVCHKFLFINGLGGLQTLDQTSPSWDGRKGLGIIAEAARRAPQVPILVRSQASNVPRLPANVELLQGNLEEAADLYAEGDVCIQPSRWEGLGLPLLECQASGLPLVTTDAPPMNEHRPFEVIPASATQARLSRHRTIPIQEVDPGVLAQILLDLHGTEIAEASRAARHYVEAEHSWTIAGPQILDILRQTSARIDATDESPSPHLFLPQ